MRQNDSITSNLIEHIQWRKLRIQKRIHWLVTYVQVNRSECFSIVYCDFYFYFHAIAFPFRQHRQSASPLKAVVIGQKQLFNRATKCGSNCTYCTFAPSGTCNAIFVVQEKIRLGGKGMRCCARHIGWHAHAICYQLDAGLEETWAPSQLLPHHARYLISCSRLLANRAHRFDSKIIQEICADKRIHFYLRFSRWKFAVFFYFFHFKCEWESDVLRFHCGKTIKWVLDFCQRARSSKFIDVVENSFCCSQNSINARAELPHFSFHFDSR